MQIFEVLITKIRIYFTQIFSEFLCKPITVTNTNTETNYLIFSHEKKNLEKHLHKKEYSES